MRSQTDYILVIDRRLFQNVSVWDPLHNSDHYMILGCLYGATQWGNYRYLRKIWILTLHPPLHGNKLRSNVGSYKIARRFPSYFDNNDGRMSGFLWRCLTLRIQGCGTRRPPAVPMPPPQAQKTGMRESECRPPTPSVGFKGGGGDPPCIRSTLVKEAWIQMWGW